MSDTGPARALTVRIGREELIVRQRYEAVSILNDILIAAWFIAGSVMFFSTAWTTAGTWCFLFGSVELMVRPAIRLSRQIHLKRLNPAGAGNATQSGQEY
ncbi:YrhK-like protein [Murinocardiopsis flavida]|uniref:YrhK-like protein n=1 Tax=Murinocardiopsis flavida TaxID=645275 RepID=A0A2P8D3P6_9ACTN|nr:YrhK family protein [Murinocardiopsis flavida]PSK91848.1 YrhK-like protein [Murinocardiopsis flavida]